MMSRLQVATVFVANLDAAIDLHLGVLGFDLVADPDGNRFHHPLVTR